ncbi:MAG: helix-turn-helix domain-containing protein [Clostridia bacterium]|nr:helix-turn-helix domain-containing protein [Clostridia bacterium]
MTTAILTQTDKLVLDVAELAKVLGVSKPVAYELIKRRGFPAVRVSERRIVIPVDSLCKWLEAEASAAAV